MEKHGLAGAGPFTNEYEAVLAGHSFDGMPRITYLELPQLWIHPRCMKIIATLLALKLRASAHLMNGATRTFSRCSANSKQSVARK
jgi:hypothetical protein